MNRAMLATVIYRMAGSPAGAAKTPFTDVAAADWFADAVAWAYENGVVKGMSATSFAPLQEITREQLAVMLLRYADLCGYDTSARTSLKDFADAAKVSDYAADAMQWAVANGILNGTDGKRLDPAEAPRARSAPQCSFVSRISSRPRRRNFSEIAKICLSESDLLDSKPAILSLRNNRRDRYAGSDTKCSGTL